MKNKARIEQLRKEVSNLMDDNSAAEVLEAIIHESSRKEMSGLMEVMEQEVSYRSEYKLVKVKSMNDEIKLEEFLDQLYPHYSDRSQATLV
jgi:hypothetical protein